MRFSLTKIAGPDLPEECLPNRNLQITSIEVDEEKIERLSHAFTGAIDPILIGLTESLGLQADIEVPVVATAGIPQPYDAWTADSNGKTTIYFNLSQWTTEALDLEASAILKHEVTHLLLHPLLFREGEFSYCERLQLIVLDEGIAHYVGFTGNREVLLSQLFGRWEKAENDLHRAFERLDSPESAVQKEFLLERANTGPFWEKFGAIAGMFRAARIFQEQGIEGLSEAVRQRYLPGPN